MNNDLNEAETRAELIDPVLASLGWGSIDNSRIRREEVIAPGLIIGKNNKRRTADIADYVLEYKGQKLAVIEAKKVSLPDTEGVEQAKRYAERLQIRFAYSTNGKGIYRIDMFTGEEGYVESYPTPSECWDETFAEKQESTIYWREQFAAVPFEDRGGSWEARYYQHNAINQTLEAISEGKDRILLTLATGTGKTFIAFQLAWKLFNSRWNLKDWKTTEQQKTKRRPRILFLADRNILADQAYNSFSAFDEDALVRIDPQEIRKKGRVPKNGNIFFTIFQTFMSGKDSDGNSLPSFGEYPNDFFDFIIIDECHRGGANDESNWRGILEYFSTAVHLGLTATPKRKGNVDTYAYFGEPVYVYSLKEGINDGFLTPFKVQQIATTIDDYTYTPDDSIIEGEVELGKRYTEDDFNKIIIIDEREKYRVKLFMEMIDQREKTIVFCATQKHALTVRDFINQFKTIKDINYCVRVTANDGAKGEEWLRKFQNNDKTIPTILTTSKKLSTGVDARNVRNIVLMRPINSMIEFKQIVGRGTRLFDNKAYFTIYDFVKAYEHFSDEEWDGDPVEPESCKRCGNSPCTCEIEPPEPCKVCGKLPCECVKPPPDPCPKCGQRPCVCNKKVVIKLADGKERTFNGMKATSFWSADGTPISAAQFIEKLYGDLNDILKNEEELRLLWSKPDTRKKLLDGLTDKGYDEEIILEIKEIINAENSDIYDVLGYIAFALPMITREERVNQHKKDIDNIYKEHQQEFLEFVLHRYVDEGVGQLDVGMLSDLLKIKYGTPNDAIKVLGKPIEINDLFTGFQQHLY